MMTQAAPALERRASTAAYVAPFLIFVAWIAADGLVPLTGDARYALRCLSVVLALALVSRAAITLKARHVLGSVLVGVAIFVVWVAPDVLWPSYRHFWLFENSLTGAARSTLPPALKHHWPFLLIRIAGSVALVPVLEELFWRAWLMRWLIVKDFAKVPLGTYAPAAFWIVAVLFASEHGPYWDVGLVAGIAYNWWMVRTRSLGDCILAHAVTNACLAAYIILGGHWQYWL